MKEERKIVTERKLQLMEKMDAPEEERLRVEQDKIMLTDTSGLSEVQR